MNRRQAAICLAASLAALNAVAQEPQAYSELVLVRPRAGETTGTTVGVQVALDPVLQAQADHRLRVLLNGRLLPGVWVNEEFKLRDLKSGTQRLQVLVMEPGGSVLVRSEEVQFRTRR